MKNLHKKILVLCLITSMAIAQSLEINLQRFSEQQNCDPFSYRNMLLLKHEIEPYTKSMKNPVLTVSKGEWDSRDVADPFVLVTPTDILMFYDGDNNDRYKIGYARLTDDFWFWEKQGIVLEQNDTGWESIHVIDPVVQVENGEWRMWYAGNQSDSPLGYKIGLVKSSDGKVWQRQQEKPVLSFSAEDWDMAGVAYADVLFDARKNLYQMWYSGFAGPISSIGYAESADAINWKKRELPVFSFLPGVIAPTIRFDGQKYEMYYAQLYLNNGMHTKISLARSTDGINWSFMRDVFKPGTSTSSATPSTSSTSTGSVTNTSAGSTSTSSVTNTSAGSVAVLKSSTDQWEGQKLMAPAITFFEQKVHLFYCAQKSSRWAIGEGLADVVFEKEGYWISEAVNHTHNKLIVIYEQPPGTEIQISVGNESNWQQATEIKGESLPYTRRKSEFNLPENLPTPYKIKLDLKSSTAGVSPVVYQLTISTLL